MKSPPYRSWKFWLILVVVICLVFPVERSNPPITGDLEAPAEVHAILKRSCYDCHSNETFWPWYSYVAPVSWLLAYDVKEGRKELNFSIWKTMEAKRQEKKLRECRDQIEEGEMPLGIYLWMHSEATLSEQDHNTLNNWFREMLIN